MRATPSVLLASLSLAGVAAAQWPQPSGVAAERGEAIRASLREFVAANSSIDGEWRIVWSDAAGSPSAVYGPGLDLGLGRITSRRRAVEAGARLLAEHRDMLGAGATSFELRHHGKVNRTHVLVYDQTFAGLPVIDGRADVRINENGVVAMFGAVAFPVSAGFATTPVCTAAQARELTSNELGLASDAEMSTRLVIWSDRGRASCVPRLAWEVRVPGADAGVGYVDAMSGAWLQYREQHHHAVPPVAAARTFAAPVAVDAHDRPWRASPHAVTPPIAVTGTVMGYVAEGFGPNGPLVNRPLAGVEVRVVGGASAFTDAQGNFSIPHGGTAAVNVTVDFSTGEYLGQLQTSQGAPTSISTTATPGTPTSIQLYSASATEFEVAQTTAFYLVDKAQRFVRQPHILGNHPSLAALDTLTVVVNDASQPCNASYQGNQLVHAAAGSNCPNFAFSTVVEHEWGHALDDAFGGIGSSELGEGFADVIANFCTGQPLIGEDFDGPGMHVRDATNSAQYPSGQAHQGGLVWMGGSWKLRERLIAKLGAQTGQQRAETIVVGSLIANAQTIPDAVLEVFLLDDDDGNLNNGTPNCYEILASYTTDHGIPSPVQSCSPTPGVVTAFGAGCPGTGTTPAVCSASNDDPTSTASGLVPPAPPGFQVAYAVVANQAMQVDGVELFTNGAGGPLSVHRQNGGEPAAAPVATVTIPAVSGPSWTAATLATPLSVAAGETIYLVHDAGSFDTALVNSGAVAASPTLVDPGIGFWVGLPPGIPDQPAWRLTCVGGGSSTAVPQLGAPALPEIGFPFTAEVRQAAPNIGGVMLLGLSNTMSGATPLPYSLAPFGANGCDLLTSFEAVLPIQSDASGVAALVVPLPDAPSLVGLVVYLQGGMYDAGANSAGVAMTGALEVQIGTR